MAKKDAVESDAAFEITKDLQEPLHCTEDQLDAIRKQLPSQQCYQYPNQPWLQKCSFTDATKCPDNEWLAEFFKNKQHQQTEGSAEEEDNNWFVSRFIGCNKGMDAVNAMRMGSGNSRLDKKKWSETLTSGGRMKLHNDVCGQASTPQFSLAPGFDSVTRKKSELHCIELMPATAKELGRAANELGWTEMGFIVTHAAIGRNNGMASFPPTSSVGVENKGLRNGCESGLCENAIVYSLDSCVGQYVSPNPIDYLSIDVEGFDFDVLLGGLNNTLPKVRCLEFEYNWMGSWKDQSLSDAVDMLDRIGFTCYWAGKNGLLWQITNYWLEHYHVHAWSNVACVNRRDSKMRSVAQDMQKRFLSTLTLEDIVNA